MHAFWMNLLGKQRMAFIKVTISSFIQLLPSKKGHTLSLQYSILHIS